MLNTIFDWLERRPHRWPVANVVMVALILALIDSSDLLVFIGALALALLALFGASAAAAATNAAKRTHPFELLLLWSPGAIAFALAAGGLWLAAKENMPLLGLVIFAGHAALLVRIASDQEAGETVLPDAPTTKAEAK